MLSMKSALLFATFSLLTTAAPILRRDASTIISDINNIDIGVKEVIATISAYQGGVAQSTPLIAEFAQIHLANRKGYADALASSKFNDADSNAIVAAVDTTVAIDIPRSVEITKSKKALLVKAGLKEMIEETLIILKNDHDTLSAAIEAKLSPESLPAGMAGVKVIDDALQSGIDDFAS